MANTICDEQVPVAIIIIIIIITLLFFPPRCQVAASI